MSLAKRSGAKQLTDFFRGLTRAMSELAKDRRLLRDIATSAKDRIYKVTKSGKTMGFGEDKAQNLKPLKPVTKRIRKWYQNKGYRTGEFFNANKSNLTMTGQMLDALKTEVNPTNKSAKVFVADTKRTLQKKSRKKGPGEKELTTNSEVAKKVAKDGRPFMGLDRTGRRVITERIKREIRDQIRKSRLK